MDTNQIADAIKLDPTTDKLFKGVFPRDDFILLNTNNPDDTHQLFICNLDNCSKPGSHWIAIERRQGNIFYFDSYGLPPIHKDLTDKLINMTQSTITWNNTQLQELNTNVCGQYAIIYCLLRARKHSFEDTIQTLHNNNQLSNHQRDHTIATFFNHHFNLPPNHNIHDINQFFPQ